MTGPAHNHVSKLLRVRGKKFDIKHMTLMWLRPKHAFASSCCVGAMLKHSNNL